MYGSGGSGSGGGGGGSSGAGGDGLLGPDGPNALWFQEATFDREGKFDNFLLSPDHPIGNRKFRWLHGTYGFNTDDGEVFERLIREQLERTAGITKKTPTPDRDDSTILYRRWEIVIPDFRGPNGNAASLLTAWALAPWRDRPHFTNAYSAE